MKLTKAPSKVRWCGTPKAIHVAGSGIRWHRGKHQCCGPVLHVSCYRYIGKQAGRTRDVIFRGEKVNLLGRHFEQHTPGSKESIWSAPQSGSTLLSVLHSTLASSYRHCVHSSVRIPAHPATMGPMQRGTQRINQEKTMNPQSECSLCCFSSFYL